MFAKGSRLLQVEDVPVELQENAVGMLLEQEQERQQNFQNLSENLKRIRESYQHELHAMIGEPNLERYHAFHERQQSYAQELKSRAEPNYAGEIEIKEVQEKAVEESRAFLYEIGFDMARASQMRGEHQDRVDDVVRDFLQPPREPNYLVLPDQVPPEVHNPWAVYSPPYAGAGWYNVPYRTSRPWNPYHYRYLNWKAGQVGTYTHIHVSNASDSDYAYIYYKTAVRFWYWVPVPGVIEMWLRMQAVDTRYDGWLRDEWGWSDSKCDQESRLYLQVIAPHYGAARKGTILDYRRTGTDATWTRHVAPPGSYRWAHLFSSDAYPIGWQLVEVGTEEWNFFWTNDVSVHSAMLMKWFLKNAYLRSTGE